jgi:demethoxyubiquinone hydroxylase (CLK1/Coq7/Cat5 family)
MMNGQTPLRADQVHARRRLIAMLRSAYSGELGAGIAYRGHRHALSREDERAAIERIENDEWRHRRSVGILLARLGARPQLTREALMVCVGSAVAVSCHLGSWILPMYFAGLLEHSNIHEYVEGAAYARTLGLADFEAALLEMAESERDHESFFLRTVASHPLTPWLACFFGWGAPPVRRPASAGAEDGAA